ncbi:MAG: DAK2 domain-containing protein, partial [Lachnospiraceae bacterium]|nr:DAK2 domain-containing protein [Lachnospiraceae bacterium]
MKIEHLRGMDFVALLDAGAANLRENASIVDNLNVFPIPDGDTGANMSMTIDGGLRHAEGVQDMTLEEASGLVADGMLLSARGNSGVILSQLFSGVAQGFKGKETATVEECADALRSGVRSAYAAVVNPTEGTILTVAREAIEYAASRISANSTFDSFAEDYVREMKASLERTPELLAVLKEAGVIDSGGAGLYYIAEGMLRAARGEVITSGPEAHTAPAQHVDLSKFTKDSVMEFGYCTEFLLQLQTSKIDVDAFDLNELVRFLNGQGDSIVAFQNGTVVKVHVHTMQPGIVLNHCQQYGEFLTLKIENMTLQHHETVIQNRFPAEKTRQKKKKYAVVTVATGDGIRRTFEELGADCVIDGGQGKNPSTEDFLEAFRKADAEVIFVLPNNSNIIMAAKQAASICRDAEVYVAESRNIGEGYAALTMLSYDSDDAALILHELNGAMQGVVTGMVTSAVRDTTCDGIEIRKDEYIGFTNKTMLTCSPVKTDAALDLLEKLGVRDHEFLILILGNTAGGDEADTLEQALKARCPALEVYRI